MPGIWYGPLPKLSRNPYTTWCKSAWIHATDICPGRVIGFAITGSSITPHPRPLWLLSPITFCPTLRLSCLSHWFTCSVEWQQRWLNGQDHPGTKWCAVGASFMISAVGALPAYGTHTFGGSIETVAFRFLNVCMIYIQPFPPNKQAHKVGSIGEPALKKFLLCFLSSNWDPVWCWSDTS